MTTRVRVMIALLGMLGLIGACDSGDGSDAVVPASESDDGTSAESDDSASESATETTEAASGQPSQDASEIDWATVDLTTIDWETIDMSQVDFEGLVANPTVSELEAETLAFIGSHMDPGSATLTIGDQTWEFDSFLCAFGHEATQSDTYSFSSDTRGDHEGARVQVQANIADPSGQGRFEGPDLTHQVYIQDVSDFENPSIHFEFNAPEGITIVGDSLTAEGLFDDGLTDTREDIPGTLEATCGDGSRR